MAEDLTPFQDRGLREALEELENLLSQSGLALLIGAGCSKCAGLPLMPELTKDVRESTVIEGRTKNILGAVVTTFAGADGDNIEDYLSEIVDLLAIAQRRQRRKANSSEVDVGGVMYRAADLKDAIGEIKSAIATRIGEPEGTDVSAHKLFIQTIHRTLMSGKTPRPAPVDYFVLNYDTLIEDALGLNRTPFADGFVGGVTGWWSMDSYEDRSVEARVYKPHGSVDWFRIEEDVRPQRLRHGLKLDDPLKHVMIWPAATKYREAQNDPHAQIMDAMRRRLRPEANQELVLVVAGYSFGDAHINLELTEGLRESRGGLTAIVFTSDNEPTGVVQEWREDASIRDQIRVHANRGFFHGDTELKSENDLPWWRFEVLTRLLGGER